jgi:flagella basal body P-ring formation protein FlgA
MKSHRRWLKIIIGLLIFLAQTLSAADTGEAIVDLVREQYQLDPETHETEILSSQLRTRLVDPADLSIRALTSSEPIGLFTVLAEIVRDGELIERGQVRMRIRRFAEVLVAADKIKRHETLGEQQFELKRTDVTSLREQPVISTAELVGQRAKRNLRMGSILTTGAMEPVPDIEVGGEVTIVFTDDWGTITVSGRALETGWVGSRVRVKNLTSGKVVVGTVVPGKSVEVNP